MIRLIALLLLIVAPAFAQAPGIEIENPWARAAPAGGMGVLYLTIDDHAKPDRLIGVSTPVARQAEVHETVMDGGMMKMRPIGPLAVTPGKPLTLAPGGLHVMLMQLTQALHEGDKIPVTLTFETAGKIHVTAVVVKPGGSAPK